jgi:hypothetical protein
MAKWSSLHHHRRPTMISLLQDKQEWLINSLAVVVLLALGIV